MSADNRYHLGRTTLGIPIPAIQEGLSKFFSSFEMNPGRLNIFNDLPFTVILDHGDNPDGICAACETVRKLALPGRHIVLLSSPSNRNARHFQEISRAAASFFDHFVCGNMHDLRGQEASFVPHRLREALMAQNVESSHITVCVDPDDAVRTTLSLADVGDLVVLFCLDSEWAADQIRDFGHKRPVTN